MAKVLLVEDDNNLREIYQARLQAEGYDIVAARDGEEALVIAKQELPDLVISDVMMPKISGFEMLDILRNTEGLRKVKVIMLTALGQADDQHRADTLGADRYLVKSQVTLEDIVNSAQELLTGEPAAAAAEAETVSSPSPAAASEPAMPQATPVTPEPVVPTPGITNEPTQAVEQTEVSELVSAEDDTPVIPLAAAPPEPTENEAEDSSPQMPPTPASTIPEPVTADEIATETAPAEQVNTENTQVDEPVPTPTVTPISVADANDMPEPTADTTTEGLEYQSEAAESDTPVATPAFAEELPVAEPPVEAVESEVSDQPLSSSQEQADIEQQIASFVESQPGTPPPVADVAPAPVEAPEELTTPTAPAVPPSTTIQPDSAAVPAPDASENTTTPEQEQALNEAVANLSGSEASTPEPAAEVSAESAAPIAPEDPAEQPAQVEPAEQAPQKVVIQPLTDSSDKPKKSLDELAAEEEAKEKALQELENKQQTPPAGGPANDKGDFDPHSISL